MHRLDFSHKNLLIYLTAGFPSLEFLQKAIVKLQDFVDAIEIGVPYSDPVADGPVIAKAAQLALEKGVNLDILFDALQEVSQQVHIPLYLMSYYAPIYAYGWEKFCDRAHKSGIRGAIIPDLNVDEGKTFYEYLQRENLDSILLVFPNTNEKRVKEIASVSGDFIYYVNFFGTTGERKTQSDFSLQHLQLVKEWSGKPVCAGFGVSDRNGYERLVTVADGVIIGSAVMRRVLEASSEEEALSRVFDFVRNIRG